MTKLNTDKILKDFEKHFEEWNLPVSSDYDSEGMKGGDIVYSTKMKVLEKVEEAMIESASAQKKIDYKDELKFLEEYRTGLSAISERIEFLKKELKDG